jgi:hydroxymethylpyrimidine/phosphomethylpyrimidine kinase
MMKIALTIAGSDSSGGAGIQADLKTFHAHGVYGVSAVTAVTVQDTRKVYDVHQVAPQIVNDQIRCLFDDLSIDVVKIGMVASIRIIEAVADALGKVELPPVVLDPVMVSKSGYHLLSSDAQAALVRHLFPLTDILTPNIDEAESLTGKPIVSLDDVKAAARDLIGMGVNRVVVKGGHLSCAPATDIACDGMACRVFEGQRIGTSNTHGTGCTFSSAIAANIARGKGFFDAVALSKVYITDAISHGLAIGHGHGPAHHFFRWY